MAAEVTAPRAAWYVSAAASLTGVLLVAAGQPPLYPPPPSAGQPPFSPPPNAGPPLAPPANTPALPVNRGVVTADPVGPLIAEARASFGRVRDYAGTFVKQERVRGQLLSEQVIAFRSRTQPFSVHMKWLQPKAMEGQEVCFVYGKNNNQMRAKSTGALKAFGFVSIDPNDPRAMKENRHTVSEAGIGNLIERLAKSHATESQLPAGHVQSRTADYLFQQRPCTRMEVFHLVNTGQFYAYRTVVYFDKEMRLPVRIEAYDWPVQGGNPQGELLECYSYVDLKFNVGLTDKEFNY